MKRSFVMFCLTALFTSVACASPATDTLLAKYKAAGGSKIDAAKAKKDWTTEVVVEGEKLSCSSCHGTDFSKAGKHHKTGKMIEAMSPRVTADRFTEEKKIEKWFKRNCKDTWGRECTVQEKADFLTFLIAQ